MINSTLLCPLALHYVPVLLFTYLHNVLWSHQSRGCWWDAWRHHARIGSLFVYFRLLRQMTRRFHHHLPRRCPKQCYGLCNWHLSKASPFNKRTILITEGQFFIFSFFFLINFFFSALYDTEAQPPNGSCATFFPYFDVICNLLLNRRTTTCNLDNDERTNHIRGFPIEHNWVAA